jgi:ABC-type uncharacterized transport system substrate-binding protein
MRSNVILDSSSKIAAIGLDWTFDDGYAQMAIDGLDANGDGVYSVSELAPLTEQNLASLKEYNYFVVPRVEGQPVEVLDPIDSDQTYINGKLSLRFTIPLRQTVDPLKQRFSFKVYDPEFFIAMDYVEKDPVTVLGKLPSGCKLKVSPVVSDQELLATQQMLSEKGTDWKPENNEDFGGLFAQPADILCN